jgi:GNAT superfamily N-acetyltransferase
MTTESLYQLQADDIERVGRMLCYAFQHDPVWNVLFADVPNREEKQQGFFLTPVQYCLRYGGAYASSPELEGVITWIPSNYARMTLWRMFRSGAIKHGQQLGFSFGRKVGQILRPLEDHRHRHLAGRDYMYLPIVGVATEHQGKGIGARLLRVLLDECDRKGLPLYLETESEQNVAMYEHLGFKVLDKITLEQLELPMWEMLREPNP